jgi:hypothetical protein
VLKVDHVAVAVVRELAMQAVARLARRPVADVVGDDDEVSLRVDQSARCEEHSREVIVQKLLVGSAGAVQNENRIRGVAARVASERAEGRVVNADVVQCLAVRELVLRDDEIAFVDGRQEDGRQERCEKEVHGESLERAWRDEAKPR